MIFIVIPVFNRWAYTKECLLSLKKQSYQNFKIIIVDDGSTDGTSEFIEKDFSDVIILKGNGNLWWTGATNMGVEYALANSTNLQEDFLLTLNNDLIVNEDYLQKLVDFIAENPKSLIGSISLDVSNTAFVEFCGIQWNEFTAKQTRIAEKINYSYSTLKEKYSVIKSDFLSGRGTLIPLSLFEEIGIYDSINFPHYAADDDFSLRARRKGYSLLIHPSIFVLSFINATGTKISNAELSSKYIKSLFFSIKSPFNLKIRYRFAIKNCKLGILYFFIDTARVFVSFMKRAVLSKL